MIRLLETATANQSRPVKPIYDTPDPKGEGPRVVDLEQSATATLDISLKCEYDSTDRQYAEEMMKAFNALCFAASGDKLE